MSVYDPVREICPPTSLCRIMMSYLTSSPLQRSHTSLLLSCGAPSPHWEDKLASCLPHTPVPPCAPIHFLSAVSRLLFSWFPAQQLLCSSWITDSPLFFFINSFFLIHAACCDLQFQNQVICIYIYTHIEREAMYALGKVSCFSGCNSHFPWWKLDHWHTHPPSSKHTHAHTPKNSALKWRVVRGANPCLKAKNRISSFPFHSFCSFPFHERSQRYVCVFLRVTVFVWAYLKLRTHSLYNPSCPSASEQ